MNSKMSRFFFIIVISCGTEAFHLPQLMMDELHNDENIFTEWPAMKNITRQFKNDLMKKTATKLMLDLFNNTDDHIFSILSERTVYNYEDHSNKRIYLRYNTTGLKQLVKNSHSSVLKFYKRKVIGDENPYIVFLHRMKYVKDRAWNSTIINFAVIFGDYEGWTAMDVRAALKFWTKHEDFNYGCFLRAISLLDDSEVNVRDIGVVGIEDEVNEPFILGFGKSKKRLLNSDETDNDFDVRALHKSLKRAERDIPDSAHKKIPCMIRPWFVMYEELGMESIIAPPDGYWANYCSGECSKADAKNHHSTFQAMVHSKKPYIVPALHCGPTGYSDRDFLYYGSNGQIIKNTLHEMAVKSCGCR